MSLGLLTATPLLHQAVDAAWKSDPVNKKKHKYKLITQRDVGLDYREE